MKVIVAGFSKTGTKTLNTALTRLGYNVFDHMEHFWEHGKYWEKILTSGGTIDDFKEMYENVDAVVDVPAFAFWEEIHQAFPEAKIIFTTRDEDSWLQSFSNQLEENNKNGIIYLLLGNICPTARRFKKHIEYYSPLCFSTYAVSRGKVKANKMVQMKKFRLHNCYVLENAPRDKLLIFNVKDGWAPLCNFLERDIPEEPFPWSNKSGLGVKQMVHTHPLAIQVKKEAFILLILCSCIVMIISVLIFYVFHF